MLALGIRYLTGYAIATDVSSRERAEWPPHPARVFMALAAAHFETGEDTNERAVLEWLETLDSPTMCGADADERTTVEFYVPVNDSRPEDLSRNKTLADITGQPASDIDSGKASTWKKDIDKKAKTAIVAPTACRIELAKKLSERIAVTPKTSDTARISEVQSEVLAQVRATEWKDFASDALDTLPNYRGKQPRHFPRVRPHDNAVFLIWPDAEPDVAQCEALDRLCEKVIRIGHSSSLVQMWVEDQPPPANLEPDELGEQRMRVFSGGTLGMLASAYNHDSIEAWADLQERIANAKGKTKAALKKELAERFGDREPRSVRPTISRWQGYRRAGAGKATQPVVSGAFDRNLLVLSIDEGPVVGLESTWQLLTAMQKTILKHCDPKPEWLSGHQPDRSPSREPHVALVPLAFVGHEHADGHLMGIGLAFPEAVAPRERGRALRGLLYDDEGQPQTIPLRLGSLGAWTLARETRPSPPFTLQGRTWTGPSATWATVTPIVLDRHPKAERAKDRQRWSLEVAEVIAESCERQGLPRPTGIDIDKTSWFRGAPRAVADKGSGFPLMPVKNGEPSRQQVHAWLRFDQLIEGPLLLGAGRYRGYGVCRPWKEYQP